MVARTVIVSARTRGLKLVRVVSRAARVLPRPLALRLARWAVRRVHVELTTDHGTRIGRIRPDVEVTG